ncbi:Hpt domain-containing protein [Sulfitobacter sp. S190]|uniref:Hpt domain-containing protein n=1 Tax=Sulfitobacter sp. S190 TaxID=2867022 RepID=UPI0021A3783D|nr:Hpt domain-containing protein [Sulfitobacter sp. S190]UWR22147.1 Hpt domain-containing protein [Sulfitobacter sp. S190]
MTHDDLIDPSVFADLQDAVGEEFAFELLETFLEDAPNLLNALSASVAAQDADAYRRASHTIKSNAQTFGATALGAKAKDMEVSGEIDGAAAQDLQVLFAETAAAFEAQRDD